MSCETLGEFLREARKILRVSQDGLGELLDLGKRTIQSWEERDMAPNTGLFRDAMDRLRTRVGSPEDREEIIKHWRSWTASVARASSNPFTIDLEALAASCRRQKEFHLARHHQEYDKDAYVPRTSMEDQFRKFVYSNKELCFPIIGEAGMGKTTVICRIAETYSQEGHHVWVFPARPLPQIRDHPLENGPDLEKALIAFLAGHLTVSDAEKSLVDLGDVVNALQKAWDTADNKEARFLVLVDAINEHPEPQELVVSLERLIQGLEGLSIRVKLCVTSRPYTWKRAIREELGNQILYPLYFGLRERSSEPSLYLGEYTHDELRTVYTNLKLQPDYDVLQRDASPMAERLRDPYMLTCATAIAGRIDGRIPIGFTKTELLKTYISYLIQDDKGTERFLSEVTSRMRTMMSLNITQEELEACAQKLNIDLDSDNSPYRRLLEAGILQELTDITKDPIKPTVGIRNDRILEYLLYEHLRALPTNVARVRDALRQAETYYPLWGALHILLTEDWNDRLLLELARPVHRNVLIAPEIRAFINSLCSYAKPEHGDSVSTLINRMLRPHDSMVGPLAVSAAYSIRDIGLLIRALQSRDSATRITAVQYCYFLWHENRRIGSQILSRLTEAVRDTPNPRVIQAFVHLAIAIGIKQFHDQEVLDELIRQSRITIRGLLYPQLDESHLNPFQKLKRKGESLLLRNVLHIATSGATNPVIRSTSQFLTQMLGALDVLGFGGPSDLGYFLRHISRQQGEDYRQLLRFVRPEYNDLERLGAIVRKLAPNRDMVFFLFAGGALMMQGFVQRKRTLELLTNIYADSEGNNALKWFLAATSDVIGGSIWVDLGNQHHRRMELEEAAREQIEYHKSLVHKYLGDTGGGFTVPSRPSSIFDLPIYRTALLEAEMFNTHTVVSEVLEKVSALGSPILLSRASGILETLIEFGYPGVIREPLLSLLGYDGEGSTEVRHGVLKSLAMLRLSDPEEADRIIYSIEDRNERNKVNSQLQQIPSDEIITSAKAYLGGSSEILQYALLKYPGFREEIIRLAEELTKAKMLDAFLRMCARRGLDWLSTPATGEA